MAFPPSGRPHGRPLKSAYAITSGRGDGALSVRVREAFTNLTESECVQIRAMVEDVDVRLASLAGIALGIGFENPSTPASMKTRIAAHELLARCCGDIQLAPGPLHVHGSGAATAKVIFQGRDAPGETQVELLPDPDSVPAGVAETDVSATVETPDPDPEHPQG